MSITPQQLPTVYTIAGSPVFASGDSKLVPANTVMDVLRYEQDLAALSPGHQITPLNVAGISPGFQNGYIATWTAGFEQKLGGANLNAGYVGTAGIKLPAMDFPNGYSGADPAFAPYTQFNSAGQVTGGYGVVSVMTNRSHSSYHALQISAQQNLTAAGLGFQASYTFSKSIDDTSAVIGGFISGQSGAVAQTAPEDPFDARLDKGPSNFDVKNALAFSLFQDLHADRVPLPAPLGQNPHRRLASAGHRDAPKRLAIHHLFGDPTDGRRLAWAPTGPTRWERRSCPPAARCARTISGSAPIMLRTSPSPSTCRAGQGPTAASSERSDATRSAVRGCENFDLALIKDTPLLERSGAARASLQFRAEFFNVFNIVNFGLPSNILLGPGFGEISRTASNSRQIQFSLKVIY